MQGSRAVADSDEKASSPTVAAWVIFSLSLLQLLRYARFNVPAARSLARLRRLATARLHQLQRLARQHLGSPAQRLARVSGPTVAGTCCFKLPKNFRHSLTLACDKHVSLLCSWILYELFARATLARWRGSCQTELTIVLLAAGSLGGRRRPVSSSIPRAHGSILFSLLRCASASMSG